MNGKRYLSVVIVDDEEEVRHHLSVCLPWTDLGYSLTGDYSSGGEVLDHLEDSVPDVIIADINMSGMDGMAMSRLVLSRYPMVKIIILTGFGELQAAREGFEVGVFAFLEKPIDPDEIGAALSRAKEKIAEESLRARELENYRKQQERGTRILKEQELLRFLTDGQRFPDSLTMGPGPYQVALVERSRDMSRENSWEMMAVVRSMTADRKNLFICTDGRERAVLVETGESQFLRRLSEIHVALRGRFGADPIIAVGLEKKHRDNLVYSWREAVAAAVFGNRLGNRYVSWFGDIESGAGADEDQESAVSDDLVYAVKAGLSGSVNQIIEHSLTTGIGQRSRQPEAVQQYLRAEGGVLLSRILSPLRQYGLKSEEIEEVSGEAYQVLMEMKTVPEMLELLERVAQKVGDIIHPKQLSSSEDLARRAAAMIEAKLDDSETSLASVAEALEKNPSYLSRIFKQFIGQSFVEYITDLRMKKARILLTDTNLKAYQIAERVGILDPHYFSVIFRKKTGLSVSRYRKTLGIEGALGSE